MKKSIGYLIFMMFIVVISKFIGGYVGKKVASEYVGTHARTSTQVVGLEEINDKLPITVDKYTRLDRISINNNEFIYDYTIVTLGIDEIDAAYFISIQKPYITRMVCTLPNGQELFREGYTTLYQYYDKNGVYITSFRITKNDC